MAKKPSAISLNSKPLDVKSPLAKACKSPESLSENYTMLEQNALLFCGDGIEMVSNLADQSIDLILIDPPYNLSQYSTGNISAQWRATFNNDIADWDKIAFDPADCLSEFCRVIKPTGMLFAFTSYNLLGRWHEIYDPVFDTFQIVVWHKTNPAPKLRRAGFLNAVNRAKKAIEFACGEPVA